MKRYERFMTSWEEVQQYVQQLVQDEKDIANTIA